LAFIPFNLKKPLLSEVADLYPLLYLAFIPNASAIIFALTAGVPS